MAKIHQTAVVDKLAVIGEEVEIGPYCVVGPNVVVGEGTRLMSHVVLEGHTKLGRECVIFPFACIGTRPQDLKYKGGKTFVELGDRTTVRECATVNSATNEGDTTRVGSDCLLMAYSHVAHACVVGNEVIIGNCTALAGEVVIEDQAIVSALIGIHQFTRVGRLCMIGGCSRITQDCPPFMMIVGNPAEAAGINSVGMQRRGISESAQLQIKRAHKILYRDGLSTSQALEKMRNELEMCDEVKHLMAFVEGAKRGIVK